MGLEPTTGFPEPHFQSEPIADAISNAAVAAPSTCDAENKDGQPPGDARVTVEPSTAGHNWPDSGEFGDGALLDQVKAAWPHLSPPPQMDFADCLSRTRETGYVSVIACAKILVDLRPHVVCQVLDRAIAKQRHPSARMGSAKIPLGIISPGRIRHRRTLRRATFRSWIPRECGPQIIPVVTVIHALIVVSWDTIVVVIRI
jgi:hypothetical protein